MEAMTINYNGDGVCTVMCHEEAVVMCYEEVVGLQTVLDLAGLTPTQARALASALNAAADAVEGK